MRTDYPQCILLERVGRLRFVCVVRSYWTDKWMSLIKRSYQLLEAFLRRDRCADHLGLPTCIEVLYRFHIFLVTGT